MAKNETNYEKGYALIHEANISNEKIETIKKIIKQYDNNKKFSEMDYWEIESKIRSEIPSITQLKVKIVMNGLYWEGFYKDVLGQMQAPAELEEIQIDYQKNKQGKKNEK